jgi:hypothetical protein
VTLFLLWEEYKARHPDDGYQYSSFCEQYRAFRRTVDPVMRQTHTAGEKLFVDYAGQTAPVVDEETGEVRPAQIFVAVLRVERVWRGQAGAGMTLHVLIPTSLLFPPELYQPPPNAQTETRELKRLAGLSLAVFVQDPPADSGRSDVRLRGESFVYVLANDELVRAGFFLAGKRDPEAQTLSSLEAAVAKAGPAN